MPYENPDAPEGVTTTAATDWYINPPSRFPTFHRWGPAIFVVIVLVVMAMIWAIGSWTKSPATPKKIQTYTYTITGTGPITDVSYDDTTGVTDLGKTVLPFSVTVRAWAGEYFITGQSTKVGSITCTVTSGSHVVSTNTVEGVGSAAACSG
jgi:hypothetical protein